MVGQSEPEKHPWRSCASKSVVETVTGSHKFIVEGYSLMKGMGTDKYVSSDVFSVGGHDWVIRFYPNQSKSKTFTGIALVSDDGGTGIQALIELRFLDKSERGASWTGNSAARRA
ncbi:unnamed protein product [Linum tenue]|uniref:MATH domain-containing protein n=1 Tax=Linum tenue TaxID=586396 RepID=A0AAV0M9B9_9ROSI|nr:unnamed protein product [Linum tenue]